VWAIKVRVQQQKSNISPTSINLPWKTRTMKFHAACLYELLLHLFKSGPARRHGGALGERRYSSYSFLTSALEGGEWSASRPGRALAPGTHCTGGWVGPRAGLDAGVGGKIFYPCRGSHPGRPVHRHTDWANGCSCFSYLTTLFQLHKRSISCALCQVLLEWSSHGEWDGQGM
jgi:hypothetical protein